MLVAEVTGFMMPSSYVLNQLTKKTVLARSINKISRRAPEKVNMYEVRFQT